MSVEQLVPSARLVSRQFKSETEEQAAEPVTLTIRQVTVMGWHPAHGEGGGGVDNITDLRLSLLAPCGWI